MIFILLVSIHFLIIFFICFWFWKSLAPEFKFYFWPALCVKLSAGIVLGLIYKHHYSVGDTFSFFEDAVKLTKLFWETPAVYFNFLWSGDESSPMWMVLDNTEARSLFFVKVISLINLFAGSNYWITSMYCSLLVFGSAFLLFVRLATTFSETKQPAAIAFLFFPSVVFWSSGVLKESIALAGLFMLSITFISLLTKLKATWWEWLLAGISIILVWNLKYYWIAVFFPVALSTMFVHVITRKRNYDMAATLLIWGGIFLILCFGVTFVHPNFNLNNLLLVLTDNYYEFIRLSPQGSITYYQLEPTWWSIFLNSPLALMSGLFRPFLWEADNFLQMMTAVENLFVLILFIAAVFRIRSLIRSTQYLLIFSLMIYVAMLCVFLALSTPNLGTLARYKVGFQPYLIFILLVDNRSLDWIKRKLKNKSTR